MDRPDDSPAASYDPMRQFAELAGDVRDPYPMLAGIRADTPVMQVRLERGPAAGPGTTRRRRGYVPVHRTSHEFAQQVLTDKVRFSSAGYAMTMGQHGQDDPADGPARAPAPPRPGRQGLPRPRPGAWSDTIIAATINELIDAFAGDGRADLIRQLTFPFPVQVIARILGLPEADWPHFLRLSTELIGVQQNWDRGVAASRELRGYFAEIIADRRRNTAR